MPAEIKIDEEFGKLIDPLSEDEFMRLEESVTEHGIRDPLVVWAEKGVLLDGHHRLRLAKKHDLSFNTAELHFDTRAEARIWIRKNQLARRNITVYRRAELVLENEDEVAVLRAKAKENQAHGQTAPGKTLSQISAKAMETVDTREALAKKAGVSHDTISRVKLIREKVDEGTKEKLRSRDSDETSINKEYKKIRSKEKEQRRERERQGRREEAIKEIESRDVPVIIGKFQKNTSEVSDNSLSLIFTDPPYDRVASKSLPLLGSFAADKLIEGGSLLCYVGHTQLPSAMDALRENLRYWWVINCSFAEGHNFMREYGIKNRWKPILWFVKGTRGDKNILVEDVISGGREKADHEWQQSLAEAEYWIDALCPEDGIVCDPYLGSGTTGLAAEKLGRQWIGFERNPDHADTIIERIGNGVS